MFVGYLLIILSIINVLSLICSLYLLFSPLYYYFIIPIWISTILYLIIFISFYRYTNLHLDKEQMNLKKIRLTNKMLKGKETKIIEFVFKDNRWVCSDNQDIEFKLSGYLFKKSFIIARIIREIRYPIVSNQKHLYNLLNFRLKTNRIKNLIIRFKYKSKVKEYFVIKNYISKNTVLSKSISEARYYKHYISRRSFYIYMKDVTKVNEDIFLSSNPDKRKR